MLPRLPRARDLVRQALDTARELLHRTRTPAPPPRAEPVAPPAAVREVPPAREPRSSWELRSQAELVEHIQQHHHEGLRRDLPPLIDAARKLEREHASHPAVPRGLADLLAELASELDGHMAKEETVLFPMLRTGARGGPIDMPIRMMERDHEDHGDRLARIRELTGNLAVPDDAPQAWATLYAGLATLESELREHIYLEDRILFARALGGAD